MDTYLQQGNKYFLTLRRPHDSYPARYTGSHFGFIWGGIKGYDWAVNLMNVVHCMINAVNSMLCEVVNKTENQEKICIFLCLKIPMV